MRIWSDLNKQWLASLRVDIRRLYKTIVQNFTVASRQLAVQWYPAPGLGGYSHLRLQAPLGPAVFIDRQLAAVIYIAKQLALIISTTRQLAKIFLNRTVVSKQTPWLEQAAGREQVHAEPDHQLQVAPRYHPKDRAAEDSECRQASLSKFGS